MIKRIKTKKGTALCQISPIYMSTSTIIKKKNKSILVDPGISPLDMEEILSLISNSPLELLISHSHWDHILSHRDMNVIARYASLEAINIISSNNFIEKKNEVKAELANYDIEDDYYLAHFELLEPIKSTEDYEILRISGHCFDQIGFYFKEEKILVGGDSLSPVEIPTANDYPSFKTYLKDLDLLEKYINMSDAIIPGHGYPLGREDAKVVLNKDRLYLSNLIKLYEDLIKIDNNSFAVIKNRETIIKGLINLPASLGEDRLKGEGKNFHIDNLKALNII